MLLLDPPRPEPAWMNHRPRPACTAASTACIAACLAAACLPAVGPAAAEEFRLLAWNVESNRPGSKPDSDARVIARQLVALAKDPASRPQIVALSEVAPADVHGYRKAVALGLAAETDFVTSASGGFRDADSLLVVVDSGRFKIDAAVELHRYGGIIANFNVDDEQSPEHGTVRARSPLVVTLRDKLSDETFRLVVVHLARSEADLRTDQARMLVAWAKDQEGPLIAAGDFNFDWDMYTKRGNPGFDALVAGAVWTWLEPDPLVDTNLAGARDNPKRDRFPDSILDFVFVANRAKDWRGESQVIVRPNDFPDDETTSDHRPILATFRPPAP
jgi:endonuclease/exonuclease/phosphatase family metal-dependent hydrolase